MCDAACRREVGKMIIDILLRLKAGGIPRHRSAALGISGLQTPKPPHRSNRCGVGRWVVSWEWQAPGTPLVCQSRTPTPRVVFASGRPTDSDFSGLGVTLAASFARCLLFDSHRGHTLFPAWANTRTASFGRSATLGSEPVRRHLSLFGNPGCDGAYPQPQWDCACSAYKY